MLVREGYLERLRPLYDACDLVKVITGVRRGGKSVLLSQIRDDLLGRVPADHVLMLNFELLPLQQISTAVALDAYVREHMSDRSGPYYVFLDEVQEVDGFEKAVNSLRASGNISVFITGSNAHLLGGELATYLSGRYVEQRVWPLSYAESLALRGLDSSPQLLSDYLRWGGMPFRFSLDETTQNLYLRDVFNSVVLRDVVARTGLRDVVGLEAILDFVVENMGRVMSPKSIVGYLTSVGKKVSLDAIYSHLRALESSMLVNKVRRYDLRGKQVMSTLDKYYATDIGLVTARRVGQGPGQGDRVENCVYTELMRRGFEVYAGTMPGAEVDFVATKNGMPRYIQSAYVVGDGDVAEREFGAFAGISDNYPKYVVSMDPMPMERNGIHHLGFEQFLLDPPAELA